MTGWHLPRGQKMASPHEEKTGITRVRQRGNRRIRADDSNPNVVRKHDEKNCFFLAGEVFKNQWKSILKTYKQVFRESAQNNTEISMQRNKTYLV